MEDPGGVRRGGGVVTGGGRSGWGEERGGGGHVNTGVNSPAPRQAVYPYSAPCII